MAVIDIPQNTSEQTDERQEEAQVLPFSRERLGRGADITRGSRILAERNSPVYLPGDPRLDQE